MTVTTPPLENIVLDSDLLGFIRRIKMSKHTRHLGYMRITEMARQHFKCHINKNDVYRLMKEDDLFAVRYKKPKPPPKQPLVSDTSKKELIYGLKRFKKKYDRTWKDIADELGVSKRTLLRWVHQRKTVPTINRNNAGKIIKFFDENDFRIYLPWHVKANYLSDIQPESDLTPFEEYNTYQ